MCGYCIESGFVFDFWQHGQFTLPEPFHDKAGQVDIDFSTACYALFEAPSPAQLTGPWLEAAQNIQPYWTLRQLEQVLLALPVNPEITQEATAGATTLPSYAAAALTNNSWPALTALWQNWQQAPATTQGQQLPATLDTHLLNEAAACLAYAQLPFENIESNVKNYQPEQDVFAANDEESAQFYAIFAEAWLAFCLLRQFRPFDPSLVSWSALMPKHMPSFGVEDLVMIRQAFWHCLKHYGAPYFIEHGPYQRAELLAYAAKRFVSPSHTANDASAQVFAEQALPHSSLHTAPHLTTSALNIQAFCPLINQYWQGGNDTGFSIEQAVAVIESQMA